MTNAEKEIRRNAVNKLVNKHFHVFNELVESLDNEGHFCYKNDSLTVYDCLFYINIVDNNGIKHSCHQSSKLYNGLNLN